MTPTPPSPEDDLLDLASMDSDKKSKPKVNQQESDFEKELEALFAEDLAEAAETGSSLSAAVAGHGLEPQDEPLLLADLVDDDAPAAQPAATEDEDILDLGSFASPEATASGDDDILDLTAADSLQAEDDGDILDLTAADALPEATEDADDDILDLSAFATDGPMDLTPPTDAPGGIDGGIDLDGLDNLISDLGDSKKPAPAAPQLADVGGITHDAPLDDIDMDGLLDEMNVPAAATAATEPADEMLELSLGDLVEGMPESEPLDLAEFAAPEPAPAAQELDEEISLPDLTEPEPGAGLDFDGDTEAAMAAGLAAVSAPELALPDLTEPELSLPGLSDSAIADAMADSLAEDLAANLARSVMDEVHAEIAPLAPPVEEHDLSGAMNLSMPEIHEEHMDPQSDLEATDIDGSLLDGFDGPMPEIETGEPMDASTLLDQINDTPEMLAPATEHVFEAESLPEPVAEIPGIGVDVATAMAASAAVAAGVAVAASASAPESAGTQMPQPMREMLDQGQKNIEDFQQKLAELKTQVIGGSITVVSIQGQLAEKDQVIAELDLRLQASEADAANLRQELAELRTALEAGLNLRSEEEEKASTQLKERLALLEDRQDQAARDMQAEIERAVPREAAKVIREEISALASTMHD